MMVRRFLALSAGSLVLAASATLGSAAWADNPTPAPSATSVDAVSCDATEPAADGSWSQKCSDGSSYVYNSDGSWVNDFGNGCVISGDAKGETSREGNCPEDKPVVSPGCWQQTDADGAPMLDSEGNPLTVCADVPECISDDPETACPMMYSTGVGAPSGRDNCPQCRNLAGGPEFASANGIREKSAAGALNGDVLIADAAALDSAATASDQAAAIERAGANQPAVSMPGTGQNKGAGPIAPIAATVVGGGLVAAGFSVWRRMSVRGL